MITYLRVQSAQKQLLSTKIQSVTPAISVVKDFKITFIQQRSLFPAVFLCVLNASDRCCWARLPVKHETSDSPDPKGEIMDQNIKRNYPYTFLQWFIVTGLWMLYLTSKGFSPLEVGIMEAVFHGTSLLFEVPSGSLADRFGYKKTLIASRLVNSFSCLLTVLSGNFWLVTIGFILSALSYNLASGTNEALVFESLLAEKKETEYLKINANINMILEISSSLGIVVAGLFSHWFFDGVYWLQIGINLLAILVALGFKEPPRLHQKKQPYFQLIASAFRFTLQVPSLLFVMLAFAFIDSLNATYYFYFQNFFQDLGINGIGISLVILISTLFQLSAVRLSAFIGEKIPLSQLFVIVITLLIGATAASGFLPVAGVIPCFILANCLPALVTPIRSNFINQLIPSEQRATINSIDSLCFSLMMIPFFPICGWLIQLTSYRQTFLIVSLALALGGCFIYPKLKKTL